jgi:hemerythrin
MGMSWTPKLAVGVQSIDTQHQELFTRVNALLDALASQKGEGEVRKVVAFLGDYVVSHFAGEERLMQQHGYPDYPAHKKIHDAFVAEFVKLKADLEKQGASASLAVQLNRKLGDWLLDHIGRTDRALGAFLQKKGAARASV